MDFTDYADSLLSGLCFIAISLLLLPPIRKYAYSKTNRKIPVVARGLFIFVLIVVCGAFIETPQERKIHKTTDIKQKNPRKSTHKTSSVKQNNPIRRQVDKKTSPKVQKVTYKIINTDTYLDIKRSLDVRLSQKVSQKTLRTIAYKLKTQDSKNYERTFICYYLPDMEIGSGAWATTHFNPDIDVKIQGLTISQEKNLKQLPHKTPQGVIGVWLNESPFMGSRITIFKRNSRFFMETAYYDGSSGEKELVKKSSNKSRAFQTKEKNSFGEFYLIDSQGHLQFWDEEGFIMTAKKIELH